MYEILTKLSNVLTGSDVIQLLPSICMKRYIDVKWTTGEWHDFCFSAYRNELQQLQSQCEVFQRKIKESIEKLTLRDDQIKALVIKTHHFERQETDANEEVSFHLEYIHLPVCSV